MRLEEFKFFLSVIPQLPWLFWLLWDIQSLYLFGRTLKYWRGSGGILVAQKSYKVIILFTLLHPSRLSLVRMNFNFTNQFTLSKPITKKDGSWEILAPKTIKEDDNFRKQHHNLDFSPETSCWGRQCGEDFAFGWKVLYLQIHSFRIFKKPNHADQP